MSSREPNQPAALSGTTHGGDADSSRDISNHSQRLVHELANLLDGSLRNISLVISRLNHDPGTESRGHGEDDHLLPRLQAADQAMRQMARLIEQWRSDPESLSQIMHQISQSFGQAVEQATELLTPSAAAHGIAIKACLSSEASRLPAGPIYPLIVNVLRNSIEAIVGQSAPSEGQGDPLAPGGCVELTAEVDDDCLHLTVRDTGPGVDPSLTDEKGRFCIGLTTKQQGHGLGLSLCADIATSLGGVLDLKNDSAGGAVLTVRYPTGHHETS